jgi:hypothetical protein
MIRGVCDISKHGHMLLMRTLIILNLVLTLRTLITYAFVILRGDSGSGS